MSPDETPASRPGSGAKPEQPRAATTDPGQGQDPAQRVRVEEAERMRERVHQREMSEEQEKPGQGAGSADTASAAAAKKATGVGVGTPSAQGAAERTATETGATAQRADAPRKGRTIASASASVPRRAEQQPAKRPIISGTAAAKLLGREPGEAGGGPASGGPKKTTAAASSGTESGPAATTKPGGGIDGPTSHIDRSSLAATEMPDLGKVRHPAPADTKLEPEPHQRTAVTVGKRRGRGPLRASMQLRSIDPWSALKVSLVVSVALFLVWMVAVAIIYVVLDGMGVWDRLNSGVSDIISTEESSSALVGPGQVFGVAAILGIINIVLMTALSTLGAFIYNMSSEMVGGVEVTLADRD
ncbi:DUF3566 domain-containing protein [Tomitella cavernea]|uniref:DUF3566 domain-containing protein n=1 Tax=Tomitella cavernea TaxID=1387982 RepID=A0ABP9C070_9ACTN|nr:DUF3566 domain-containing protein [Tomitella cavernea]